VVTRGTPFAVERSSYADSVLARAVVDAATTSRAAYLVCPPQSKEAEMIRRAAVHLRQFTAHRLTRLVRVDHVAACANLRLPVAVDRDIEPRIGVVVVEGFENPP
jgi:hypothetical protein